MTDPLFTQVLEALDYAAEHIGCEHDDDLIGVARRALKERLARDAALDRMAQNARELGLDYEPVRREPVTDRGPWQVDLWSEGRVVLQSDDFTHDVALIISGDFESGAQKLAYANALARKLNAAHGRKDEA